MKYLATLIILLQASVFHGQKGEITQTDLLGCWIDSREENIQGSDTLVYRPCDYMEFSTSRFRFKMELMENRECAWFYLSPNDAHHMKAGTWTFDQDTGTLVVYDLHDVEVRSFVVLALWDSVLGLKD